MISGPFYVQVPFAILTKDISPTAKVVWAYLRFRQGGNGKSWPSHGLMARELHLAKTTVARAVDELGNAGLLEVAKPEIKGRGHYWEYTLKGLNMKPLKGSKTKPFGQERVLKRPNKRSVSEPELDAVENSSCAPATFVPPTPSQVKEYADSIGYPELDAAHFCRKYAATDWHFRDGTKMKNWKLTVLGWQKRERGKSAGQSEPDRVIDAGSVTDDATEEKLDSLRAQGIDV